MRAAKAFGMVVGITGLIQVVLGILFWSGLLQTLIPLHMVFGFLFVLALWAVAALAIRARVPAGLIALAFVWGAVVILLGMTQAQLLPGPQHWIIRGLHLLVGLGAMGQARGLVRRIEEGTSRKDSIPGAAERQPAAG